MKPAAGKTVQDLLISKLMDIEKHFICDVISYFGSIVDGNENHVLKIVEELVNNPDKKDKIFVVLTTGGGSATAVERYVNILRKHYNRLSSTHPYWLNVLMSCIFNVNNLTHFWRILGKKIEQSACLKKF